MMRIPAKISLLTAAAALAFVAADFALAAGGGGGGGGGGASVPSESAPSYDPVEEYRKGVEALDAKNYKAATVAFRRVTRAAAKNENGHYLLGVTYMRQNDFKNARKPLEKAVKLAPSMVIAQRDLGITYAQLKLGAEAQRTLANIAALDTKCAGRCPDAAAIADAKSKVEAAINGASVSAGPDMSVLASAAGDALYSNAVGLINQGHYDRALAVLDRAALAFGPHPDILTYQGFANRKLGQYGLAESYYRSALAIAPDHRGAWEYYGELKVERGDLAGARRHLVKLESLCTFGCYEADELRQWIVKADKPKAAPSA